jgi:hypothetical protein
MNHVRMMCCIDTSEEMINQGHNLNAIPAAPDDMIPIYPFLTP